MHHHVCGGGKFGKSRGMRRG
ncbi:protein of unknown function [Streptomyces murinus]